MSDKTKPTTGPWENRNRFVQAPGSVDTWHGSVLGVIAQCHDLKETDFEGRTWTANGTPEANAALIAAAGTAAHEVAQQGYDPVEAVRALPHALRTLENAGDSLWFAIRELKAQASIPADDADMLQARLDAVKAALASAAGNGGDDGTS